MFGGFTKYLEMLREAGPIVFVVIGLVVAVLLASLALNIMRGKRKVNISGDQQKAKEYSQGLHRVQVEEGKVEGEKEVKQSILGTGQFKAMVFCPGNILAFTTIPKPIGEMYQFDPSCPVSGMGYIVKEQEDGKVVDYDPREVRVKIAETPEYAWFATHWDIVSVVFSVVTQWWRSRQTWFAVGMMLMVFITALVVFD